MWFLFAANDRPSTLIDSIAFGQTSTNSRLSHTALVVEPASPAAVDLYLDCRPDTAAGTQRIVDVYFPTDIGAKGVK